MWKRFSFIFLVFLVFSGCNHTPVDETIKPVSLFAFGSCNRDDLPQPLWKSIVSLNPALWIWGGDTVYADTEDMDVLAQKYQKQKNNLEYQKLLALEIPTLGVWDDHDYGVPDGGIEYPKKKESQKLFLDFLDEPLNSARRTQEGVYAYYDFGPKNQQIRIILLDGRYFRDQPGPDGDMLGEAQWAFLEKALYTSHARYNFILSGTQVLPEEHRFEKWSNFPKGKERLLKSIETYSPFIPVVFLSGDRHLAEISQWPQGALKIHYPLYDFTSSGLTHSYRTSPPEANRYRVGEFFTELNFGTVMIDWEKNQLHLQVRDQNANIVREVIF